MPDTPLSAIKKAVLRSGRGMTRYHSGIVNPLLTVTQEMADIKVVLSLLIHKRTHTTTLCDLLLKRRVNHQPGGHSTSSLISGSRGEPKEKELAVIHYFSL